MEVEDESMEVETTGAAPMDISVAAEASNTANDDQGIRVSAMEAVQEKKIQPHVQKMRDLYGQRMLDVIGTAKGTPEELRKRIKDAHSVDYQNDGGVAALYATCWHAKPELAKVCLEEGANVDLAAKGNITPLMTACSTGNVEMVQLLLDAGAYVNAVTPDGRTALSNALNHPTIVRMLLERGADRTIKHEGLTPLEQAKQPGMMFKDQRSVSVQILHEADQFDLLKEVAARRALDPPDAKTGPELFEACKKGKFDEVSKLLQAGADVTWADPEKKRCALWGACRTGKTTCARLLLAEHALVDQVDDDGVTPLSVACQYGHKECVELCLDHGARVNAATKKGYTPLLTAVSNRQTEIAEMLLERGARPDVKAGDRNALEWAKLVVRAAPNAERKRLVKKLEAMEKSELEAQQQMTRVMANAAAANMGPRE